MFDLNETYPILQTNINISLGTLFIAETYPILQTNINISLGTLFIAGHSLSLTTI